MTINHQKPSTKKLLPLLASTWSYRAFTDNDNVAHHAVCLDAHDTMKASDGGYTISENGELIGVLLYKHQRAFKWLRNFRHTLGVLWHVLYLTLRSPSSRRTLKSMVNIHRGYQAMLKQSRVTVKDEVVLFITSAKHQGKGLGKKLMEAYQNDLKKQQKPSFYLFTDTSCNFGFYDHLGFERLETLKVDQYLKNATETETLFLYEKHL